jgi:hypothetical protein
MGMYLDDNGMYRVTLLGINFQRSTDHFPFEVDRNRFLGFSAAVEFQRDLVAALQRIYMLNGFAWSGGQREGIPINVWWRLIRRRHQYIEQKKR